MPHLPLGASPDRYANLPDDVKDRLAAKKVDYAVRRQLFPQTIAEIDWSVAQVVAALERLKLDKHTLVLFTTDNGPAISSAGPLRGKKGQCYEGGMRVPLVAYWPGRIPAGTVSDEPITAMDILPTLARLAGAKISKDREIDGHDVWDVLSGKPNSQCPREVFLYYHRESKPRAARSGPWKIVFRTSKNKRPAHELYNLIEDVGEQKNLAAKHPDQVARLVKLAAQAETSLAPDRCRAVGRVTNPRPLVGHDGTIRKEVRP